MADIGESQDRKKLLLAVMLVGGIGYLTYTYIYTPQAQEVAALETRLETLRLQNQTARLITERDGRSDVERRLGLYRQQLAQVEGLIPSSEELPDLLDAISAEARRSGVELALIQPTGATAETYYTRRTYDLAVLGSYHQIGEFLSRVGSLPRIITPLNLNLTVNNETAGEPRLEAKFSIETYVLPTSDPTEELAAANGT